MLWAFLLRDLRHEASYKVSFAMQLLGSVHLLLLFFFLSRFLGDTAATTAQAYGSSYFPFVVTGLAVQQYLYLALNNFSGQLREAQLTGTFEAVMVCPVPLPLYLMGSALFAFVLNTIHILVFLGMGHFLGAAFPLRELPAVMLVLVLSAVAFSSLGIFAASYIVIFKKGNPLAWVFLLSSSLLGGVYYPVTMLPGWVQKLAVLVPMTHCLNGLRGLMNQHAGLGGIAPSLLGLIAWISVGLPASGLCFAWAVRIGRKRGSLGQY